VKIEIARGRQMIRSFFYLKQSLDQLLEAFKRETKNYRRILSINFII